MDTIPAVVVTGLFTGLAGFIAGALSRQPEINELKEQVRFLQEEVDRLHGVIRVQNEQIRELKIRYTALKGSDYSEKMRQRGYLRGSIMYQYAFKDYLEILIKADRNGRIEMNEEQIRFYNAFGKILSGKDITDDDRKVVMDYILSKHRKKIDDLQEPDFGHISKYFESGDAV